MGPKSTQKMVFNIGPKLNQILYYIGPKLILFGPRNGKSSFLF